MTLTTLKARVRTWQRRAGLTHWTVEVRLRKNIKASVNGSKKREAVDAAVACADMRAVVEFDEDRVNELDTDGLDQLICHELGHVLDWSQEEVFEKHVKRAGLLYDEWAEANEKAIDHRARILVNAYRRKRDRNR